MKVFIDIETIPTQSPVWIQEIKDTITAPAQYKKQDSIDKWLAENGESAAEEQVAKTSFNGGMGQIFCIGLVVGDGEPVCIKRKDLSLEAEKEMLIELNSYMKKAFFVDSKLPRFVGHNISGFDLRFVFHRFVVHGIKPGFPLPANDASWKGSFYDTMTEWAGYQGRVSLDNLCKYLGIDTPKTELDGSKVWEYVKAGKWQEVWDYNIADVIATREVYKRLNFEV